MARGGGKTGKEADTGDQILYGILPSLRPGRVRDENARVFAELKKAEIARLEDGDEIIIDTVTGQAAGGRDGKALSLEVAKRDDAILDSLQARGIAAVWYLRTDNMELIQQMLTVRAADLGLVPIGFDSWQHQGACCSAVRVF